MRALNLITVSLAVCLIAAQSPAQRSKPKPPAKPRQVVFAVLNDGKVAEPIGYIDKGKLAPAIDGASEAPIRTAFHRTYFKPETRYKLIFGGTDAGSVTVKSSDAKAECVSHTAQISFASEKAKLRGNVMALATNAAVTTKGSAVRRLPTAAERTEIEAQVRDFLVANKVSADAAKVLKYHNLTALDVDFDGTAEMIGTFWVETAPRTRALLFFIADRNTTGRYKFGFTDFRLIEEKDVMSGEISAVDSGVYHERLLDVLDVDNDGVAEVFTYISSFEGAGFNAYRRDKGKWVNVFEGSNYHCGY